MPKYSSRLPAACPPSDADKVDTNLYRAIDGASPKAKDFQSYAERNRPGINPDDCDSWGLSVWPDMNAVAHGRRAIPALKRKAVIRFPVTKDDGCLKFTPSRQQRDHHTFWCAEGFAPVGGSSVVMLPEPRS